jgi:hypothetical protein
VAEDESPYLLTNAELETVDRFAGLEAVFDPVTRGHLTRLGLAPGARCLEVGAGNGSIARWMADQVGPAGQVLAVDLDPGGAGPTAARSSRCVLWTWWRIRSRPAPGTSSTNGWCCSTSRNGGRCSPVWWRPWRRAACSWSRTWTPARSAPWTGPARAFNRLLRGRGGVSDFAANVLRSLREHGLAGTGASGYVAIDHGGTGWATVQAANARQLRDGLVGEGIAPEDLDRFLEVLGDPETVVGSSVLISAWGRRP